MRGRPMQKPQAHLSELVRSADAAGPQAIAWHGKAVAVVLSKTDYDRLTGAEQSLVGFMRRSPLYGSDDVDLTRDTSPNPRGAALS